MATALGLIGGDFTAAVELVTTVVNALGENSEARLHTGDLQHRELVGLRQAAAQCQQTIDSFWQKIQKYQPHLQSNGSGLRLKDEWMKIKWATCKKDDVAKFKAALIGHTESIHMLLATVQIEDAHAAKERQELHNRTLATKLQAWYTEGSQRLSTSISQGKQLLHIAAKILRKNLEIFQIVVAIQTMVANLPSQIDRQQPVYLIDALGRHSPFHLEFIKSTEALIAVMKVNFKALGEQAVRKIKRGRFVIQDSATKRDIDLAAHWDSCFYPGQRVEMSIIFTSFIQNSYRRCPRCEKECNHSVNSDIECPACGTKFRRIGDDKLGIDDLEDLIR
ncbi:hypothetical protein VF21_07171 [Pseudogymnoascus sp. 05NY08]|nr:hypothetical protein VF21_07171 [Pseudogymnoascus sp. 05NY08]